MGEKARLEFSDFRFLLNMEASTNAVPGYLKLGFHPLFIKRTSISHRLGSRAGVDEVTRKEQPEPTRMAQKENSKIILDQDSDFIVWRYSSPLPHKYLFYYYKDDYAVIGRTAHSDIAHVLDFSSNNLDSLELIFKAIYHTPRIGTLAIRTLNFNDEFNDFLKKLKFSDNNIKNKSLCPLLVRPAINNSWFIKGLDIRDVNNWHLRGISSEWC
jgi:hypothetical protein